MYRIRFHGRGGQGVKTASRILGTAFFHEGYEVQDAPRYGAERRGAPIFAYVRASRSPILERGVIAHPDLVVVIDETLLPLPAAGVLEGLGEETVLLVKTGRDPEALRAELKTAARVLPFPPMESGAGALPLIAAAGAGAAARLMGTISEASLAAAIEDELHELGEAVATRNRVLALAAYRDMAAEAGSLREGADLPGEGGPAPRWVEIPLDEAPVSAPAIHGGGTSALQKTGLWRTQRPVIDLSRCHRCSWVCGTYCPDNAITLDEQGFPHIDYEHCKGCMICLAQCPPHAITAILESEAGAKGESQGETQQPAGGER